MIASSTPTVQVKRASAAGEAEKTPSTAESGVGATPSPPGSRLSGEGAMKGCSSGGIQKKVSELKDGGSYVDLDIEQQSDGEEGEDSFPSGAGTEARGSFTVHTPASAGRLSHQHKTQALKERQDLKTSEFSKNLSDLEVIKNICCTKIAEWAALGVKPQHVVVSQILAGLTNQLFKCELASSDESATATVGPDPAGPLTAGKEAGPAGREGGITAEELEKLRHIRPQRVLFRIYGDTVADLYDTNFEFKVFNLLARNDAAPKLIAAFDGGRIEEYILGPALLCENMTNPAILCGVATILARFHRLHEHVEEMKSWPEYMKNSMWPTLENWASTAWRIYMLAQQLALPSPNAGETTRTNTEARLRSKAFLMSEAERKSVLGCLKDTRIGEAIKEVPILKQLLLPNGDDDKSTPILSIGFCHNDCQENNILVTGTRLRLIDFEYSNFNYPAFDIANFMCETTIDYCVSEKPYYTHKTEPADFPGPEVVRLFGSVYLSQLLKKPIYPSDDAYMRPFVAAVYRFALASHLFWGMWSIIRAPQAQANSDFDYLLYARSRFDAYFKWKQRLIANGFLDHANFIKYTPFNPRDE